MLIGIFHLILNVLGLLVSLLLLALSVRFRALAFFSAAYFVSTLTAYAWYFANVILVGYRVLQRKGCTPETSTYRKEMRSELYALTGKVRYRSDEPMFPSHRALIQRTPATMRPVIFVTNHYSRFNLTDVIPLSTLLPKNTTIIYGSDKNVYMHDHLYLHGIKRSQHGGPRGDCTKRFLREAKAIFDRGFNILVYPEGKNLRDKYFFAEDVLYQSGAFLLAKQENIAIVPLVFSEDWCPWQKIVAVPKPIRLRVLKALRPEHFSSMEEMRETCRSKVRKVERLFATTSQK